MVALVGVSRPDGYWFEDDPILYLRGYLASNPFQTFYDRQYLDQFLAHNEFDAPLYFWYWIDSHIAFRSLKVAYTTNALGWLAAILLFYTVLKRYLGSALGALAGATAWLVLPSSIVAAKYLSAGYYYRGMALCLIALLLAHTLAHKPKDPWRILALALISYAAMVSKEFFVTALPSFLFLYFFWHRRWRLMLLPVALVATYSAHRIALLGFSVRYAEALATPSEFSYFVSVIPHIFSANTRGYLLFAVIAIALIFALIKGRDLQLPRTGFVLLAAILIVSIGVLWPISKGIASHIDLPGTHYRSLIIVNAIIIATALWASLRTRSVLLITALIASYLYAVPKGSRWTVIHFGEIMAHNAAEGRFLFEQPDSLLYSTVEARWFIGGLSKLYSDKRQAAYLLPEEIKSPKAQTYLKQFSTIYRFKYHGIENDPVTWENIRTAAASPGPLVSVP